MHGRTSGAGDVTGTNTEAGRAGANKESRMNTVQAHLDIARERFLELMAQRPNVDAQDAAVAAIEDADTFMRAYSALTPVKPEPVARLKGCRACHGSGGKQLDPCKACAGTGKVAA